MKINSNHSNQAFNREIDKCRTWLQVRTFNACGYSSGVLLDRLTQRLAEIGHYPYASTVSRLCKTGSDCFPTHGSKINCDHAFMEIGTGRVIVTPKQWLSSQLDFFMHWAFCLIAILTIKTSRKNAQPAVLVFGVGEEALFKNGSDEQFINYCRFGPIGPLRNGRRFFIQSTTKDALSSNTEVTYSRNPLIGLLRESRLGFLGRLGLLAKHLALCFAYFWVTIRFPSLSLLGKDFSYSSISFELDSRGLIDSMLLTCSSYTSQPLWVRGLHRSVAHMIWYAQNWRPLAYTADKVVADLPQLRWIRVDTHWVWTHAFASYLKALGHVKAIEVVGPILWYLPEIITPPRDAIEIVVFDAPPVSDDALLRGGGEITNYYRTENLYAFIRDITALKIEIEQIFCLPVRFRLKIKRDYNPTYDKGYFDHLEKLNALGNLTLEAPTTNLYTLISGSHLVIAYPFSTAGYISESLKVPVIFYDPTGAVLRQDFGDSQSLINFANSPEMLRNVALLALSLTFSNNDEIH